MRGSYKRIRAFGMPTTAVFAYCIELFVYGIMLQIKVVGRIVEAEMSVLLIGVVLRAVRAGPVKSRGLAG